MGSSKTKHHRHWGVSVIGVCVLTLILCAEARAVDWDYTEIAYGPETRQWLNIALPDNTEPIGIFLWAHPNGGTAYSMSQDSANAMLENGYAVISWESVERLQTESDIQTGWEDAELMFDFVRANAARLNLNPDNIIIGGRSRGSIVSWKLAYSGHSAIKAIYMYNALPESVWANGNTSWVDDVTEQSPLTYLVFGPAWGDEDSHRPDNVLPIQDRYEALGISNRFTLYQDMWGDFTNGNGQWTNEYRDSHYFPELLAKLSGPVVSDAVLNSGQLQRSSVEYLSVTLDGNVDFQEGAFSVVQRSTASEETFEAVEIAVDIEFAKGQTIATIRFESHVRNADNALEDGNYQLTLIGNMTTLNGMPMGQDFVFGDQESDGFFSFYGDSNGDRSVTFVDILDFQDALSSVTGERNYNRVLDYNANGRIGYWDFVQFTARIFDTLPFMF